MSDANPSGFTANEAKEFHSAYMQGFIGFTIVAIIAHILVWLWRPWFPSVDGYAMLDNVQSVAASFIPYIA
ncbi:MAG: light-harvesting antenna LH1, beta subunit [Pseudomonadota bacterium]